MIARSLANGFFLLGVALLGVAAVGYLTVSPGADADRLACVTVDETERIFADATAGQALDVAFRVSNAAGRTARVVGLAEC